MQTSAHNVVHSIQAVNTAAEAPQRTLNHGVENREADVKFYRMLYQLAQDPRSWKKFASKWKASYQSIELYIETVIGIVAELENIQNVKDMTVILCVDDLHHLVSDGTKSCDPYRVLTSMCGFLNSSRAFAVCVCSATVHKPISQALADSSQKRVVLVPLPLRGDEVLTTTARFETVSG
ncbi:unnamed protein product [Phytophthora lilii]|uniref:Unnamed protein product n=1 Tax=Phytophthora lilii TaxID=2077276 RepID=A0A9W6XAK2_9STRA|nr:unnamed protein product [Phytophthora lilii]